MKKRKQQTETATEETTTNKEKKAKRLQEDELLNNVLEATSAADKAFDQYAQAKKKNEEAQKDVLVHREILIKTLQHPMWAYVDEMLPLLAVGKQDILFTIGYKELKDYLANENHENITEHKKHIQSNSLHRLLSYMCDVLNKPIMKNKLVKESKMAEESKDKKQKPKLKLKLKPPMLNKPRLTIRLKAAEKALNESASKQKTKNVEKIAWPFTEEIKSNADTDLFPHVPVRLHILASVLDVLVQLFLRFGNDFVNTPIFFDTFLNVWDALIGSTHALIHDYKNAELQTWVHVHRNASPFEAIVLHAPSVSYPVYAGTHQPLHTKDAERILKTHCSESIRDAYHKIEQSKKACLATGIPSCALTTPSMVWNRGKKKQRSDASSCVVCILEHTKMLSEEKTKALGVYQDAFTTMVAQYIDADRSASIKDSIASKIGTTASPCICTSATMMNESKIASAAISIDDNKDTLINDRLYPSSNYCFIHAAPFENRERIATCKHMIQSILNLCTLSMSSILQSFMQSFMQKENSDKSPLAVFLARLHKWKQLTVASTTLLCPITQTLDELSTKQKRAADRSMDFMEVGYLYAHTYNWGWLDSFDSFDPVYIYSEETILATDIENVNHCLFVAHDILLRCFAFQQTFRQTFDKQTLSAAAGTRKEEKSRTEIAPIVECLIHTAFDVIQPCLFWLRKHKSSKKVADDENPAQSINMSIIADTASTHRFQSICSHLQDICNEYLETLDEPSSRARMHMPILQDIHRKLVIMRSWCILTP